MNIWKIDAGGELTALSQDAGADTGVWVPSEQIAFHRAELPPGRQKMWEQTAPFVIEEQLVTAVDDQHFAIGRPDGPEGEVPVAVVAAATMQTWLDALHEREIKPRAVWPDVLAVPCEQGKPTLWHEGGRCLLRFDAQTGLAGSPEWVHTVLDVGDRADDVRIFSDDAAALPEAWRERAAALPCSLGERMLAGADQDAAGMNLLQGAFRPLSVLTTWGKPWKWAGAAAAAVLALYFGMLMAETRLMSATAVDLKQASLVLYRQHFSEQEPLTNLRTQVGRRMEQVKGGVVRRETSPWQTLVLVEPVISSCKACRVEEVKFERSSVLLLVSSSVEFDGLLRQISELGQVKVNLKPLPDVKERKRLRLELTLEKAA